MSKAARQRRALQPVRSAAGVLLLSDRTFNPISPQLAQARGDTLGSAGMQSIDPGCRGASKYRSMG